MPPSRDYNQRRITHSPGVIERERQRRECLWERLRAQYSYCRGVPNEALKSLRINLGRSIFLDYEDFTKELDETNGVTVSISVRQRDKGASTLAVPYPSSPSSNTVNRDKAAINATKNCRQLGLPVFVVFRNRDKKLRDVRLGYVETSDDSRRMFHVAICPEPAERSTGEPLTK